MIETITYNEKVYSKFQSSGNAARFIIPFAKEVCIGHGLDIGYGKKEWKFIDAHGIEPSIKDDGYGFDYNGGRFNATNLPECALNHQKNFLWDYIFSSHCLEHLDDWIRVLDYWYKNIRVGGVLFLYLPSYDQEYWRPWNNTKHKNIFTPTIMYDYFIHKGFKNVFVSGIDLNNSFAIMGEK